MRSLREIDPAVHFTTEATLDALGPSLAHTRIAAILADWGFVEQRLRKLSLVLTVLLCIAMNLFTDESLDEVLAKLLAGPRFLRPADQLIPASASAIAQRRQQVGVLPLAILCSEICHPLATPATPDAFAFGLRLMAIDGTIEELQDTAANAIYFGRHTGGRGSSLFPQARVVYLGECGTHALCDVVILPMHTSERVGALRVLRSVENGMLVLWDRGLHSYEMCFQTRLRGGHWLSRVSTLLQFPHRQRLPDGSYLATVRPSAAQRRAGYQPLPVRVIEYTFNDPQRPGHRARHRLLTSLLDPHRYPAYQLICLYHARWELELTIDETDTHQRHPQRPLRSRTPEGVFQEIYGLVLAHYAIRAAMHAAAVQADLPPTRLSFMHTLCVLRAAVFQGQIVAEAQWRDWFTQLLAEVARKVLPIRENRINPRVTKHKMSKFDVKRIEHYHYPQPTKPFIAAIVILN